MASARPSRAGIGLLELLITLALFSVVGLLSFAFLTYGVQLGRRVESSGDASTILRRAQFKVQSDLLRARGADVVTADVPDQVGGGGLTGRAVAFRSAIDPASGVFCQKPDGTPLWQKTILYYLAVPSQHDTLFGQACAGGVGPGGYDDRCPHKMLIRKVIDQAPATTPSSAQEEPMLADLSPHLTQPVDFSLSSMTSEPGVVGIDLVAQPLLWFDVRTDPSGSVAGEVQVDLRAVMIGDARKKVPLGLTAMAEDSSTLQQLFTVIPKD